MMDALRDYWSIWRVTTVQREARAMRLMRGLAWLLLAIAIVILCVAISRHKLDAWVTARVALALGAFWLVFVWMFLFVPGSLLLNTAANARLLPRQRRRLVQMFVGSWLLLTAALTAVADRWTEFPVTGAYILAFGLMFAGNMHALGLVVLIGNWPWLSHNVLPPALAQALSGDTAAALLLVLLVPAGVWSVRWIYPAGGDAHFERRSKQARWAERLKGSAWAQDDLSRGGVLTYAAALRRDCKAADPGRMLLHALGPAVHWSAWIGSLVVMLLAAVAVRVALIWGASASVHNFVQATSLAGLGALVLTILFSTAAYGQQMGRTPGEQSLLRLSPLAGDTALLNRRLATQMLQGALRLWIGLTLAILAVSALVSGDLATVLRELALCCLAGQVAMSGLLADYAGTGGWNVTLGLRAALVALAQAMAAVALGWLSGVSIWLWMIVIAIATCAFQLRGGWARMLAAPPAFPAGRLMA
jgi:hypothetical protein